MNILFVCTGNICRSPIAERLMQDRSDSLGLGLEVSSAGVRARNGHPVHPEAQRVLQLRNIDAGDFASRLLTERVLFGQDLVVGLAREHRAAARQLAPAQWKRMLTLREIPDQPDYGQAAAEQSSNPSDPSLDIIDPIGLSSAVFDAVASEIETGVDNLASWLLQNRDLGGLLP